MYTQKTEAHKRWSMWPTIYRLKKNYKLVLIEMKYIFASYFLPKVQQGKNFFLNYRFWGKLFFPFGLSPIQ